MTSSVLRGYANTRFGQLHYRYAGQGEPLLMLHQTASSSAQFERVIPMLAASYRVLALDTPGFGMSDSPPHPYTAEEYAACVVAFLDAVDIERTSIFAHHTGATFGCEVAAGYPNRVDKLILYGPPYWEESLEFLEARLSRLAVKIKEDGSHLAQVWAYISGRLREGLFPRPYSSEALEAIEKEVIWKLVAGERFAEAYHAIYRYPIMERLPLIEAPTLVMSGTEDTLLKAVEPVAARVRRSRTCVIEGGSFYTSYDNPEVLAREILNFLKDPGV